MPKTPIRKYKVVIRETRAFEVVVEARSVLEADQMAVGEFKRKFDRGLIDPVSISKPQVVSTTIVKGTNVSKGASR